MGAELFNDVFKLVGRQSTTTPGGYVALGIARRSERLVSRAFLHGEQLDTPRRSAIASLTKPITATAIMQLVENRLVELDAPVADYLPEFLPAAPTRSSEDLPVTVRHVLSHTSGLSDLPDATLRTLPPTPTAMLNAMCHARLRFAPGSAFLYCSESWFLLSAIIERVSGLTYPTFLRERVLRPLGMDSTTFDPTSAGPAGLPAEGRFPMQELSSDDALAALISLQMPGGGLWSTPNDVLRFGRAMLLGGRLADARILDRRSVDAMVELQTDGITDFETGESVAYAVGWGLSPGLGASPSAFAHNGATGSLLLVDPPNDIVIAYLRNWWSVPMDTTYETVDAVYRALAG